MFDAPGLAALRQLFEGEYGGAGSPRWPAADAARLRGILAGIPYWTCDGHTEERHLLRLDEDRLPEADEAAVPVLTPDGPGVLAWANSD